jgi:hypothetical protein
MIGTGQPQRGWLLITPFPCKRKTIPSKITRHPGIRIVKNQILPEQLPETTIHTNNHGE